MEPSKRMLRVNELLKRELGLLCEREVIPEVPALTTVTAVKASPDLRQATVYVSVLGDEAQAAALAVLQRKRAVLQHELGQHCELKYTPVLHFKQDKTLERADRVLSILDELEDEPPATETSEDETADDSGGASDDRA